MRRVVGLVLVALWVSFGCAATLALAAWTPPLDLAAPGRALTRGLAPDVATVVLVAAVGRLDRRDLVALALAATLGRVAFTAATPLATLTGCLLTALVADGLRGFADLASPPLRLAAAGFGTLAMALWMLFVDYVRFEDAGARGELEFGALDPASAVLGALIMAAVTAAFGFALWPLFARLPGLDLLERRAF